MEKKGCDYYDVVTNQCSLATQLDNQRTFGLITPTGVLDIKSFEGLINRTISTIQKIPECPQCHERSTLDDAISRNQNFLAQKKDQK